MRFLSAFLLTVCAWAASAGTVAELVSSVRAGLKAGTPDAEIARMVHDARLGERVDLAVVEEMQAEGAGLETAEALDRLRWQTEKLPAPSEPVKLLDPPAAPTAPEQNDALEKARAMALAYTANLPNFLCTEMVHRYRASSGSQNWKEEALLKVGLAYSTDKGERYRLLEINGKPTDRPLSSTGDMWSTGEFGSLLALIFGRDAAAQFQWERWANLRGRPEMVFSFRIDPARAVYHVTWKSGRAMTGLTGLVYIDRETHKVMRFSYEAVGIPSNSPVLRTPCLVDYDYAEVGGQTYLLPKRADSRVILKNGQDRNVLSFGSYRKFAGEATVTFDK